MDLASYADRLHAYAEAVASGAIPASELTRLSCERHIRDMEKAEARDPDFPYRFDPERGGGICAFTELFPHIKGHWARNRSLLVLEPWQIFCQATPFGWVDADTNWRRFRQVYIEVPRKNAKTTLSAPVGLYMLAPDGEQGAECVVAATKKEQAKIAFNIAKNMAEKAEGFRTEFGIMVGASKLFSLETNSTLIPLDSRGGTQDGANIHFALNDELHAWKGREMYDVIESALGSRTQPLIWNITTAGSDTSGICYEKRDYLIRVLRRKIVDETFFGIIYTIDEGDDPYSEATWRKANPNYGVSILPHDMKALASAAKTNAKSRGNFLTKRLNVWTNAATTYFDLERWDACADLEMAPEDFGDDECIVSFDLASKRDFNAGIRIFERGNMLHVFTRFWLPRAAVDASTNASMTGWVADGHIQVTEGDVVDYDVICDTVIDEWAVLNRIGRVAFDPYQAQHAIQKLQGEQIECVEVRPTVLNFSEPMKELDARTYSRRIRHDGNPVMRWMMGNVVALRDHKDNVYPRKARDENKIDGPVALIGGLALILNGESADLSVFEELAKQAETQKTETRETETREAKRAAPNHAPGEIDYLALNDIDHPLHAEMAKRWLASRERVTADE